MRSASKTTRSSAFRIGKLAAVAAVAALAFSACAADTATTSGADGGTETLGDASIQLSWIKNAEFMGEFMAEKNGYYAEAGLGTVDLVAGPPTSAEATVIAGNVDLALGNAISTGTVIANEGAPIKIIGATYQKNPFAILSLKGIGNISTVDGLKGKTVGVQASNLNLWEAFLSVNELTDADVTTVPVEYDPTPLFNGEVDGWFGYLTNEAIDADLAGLDPVALPLADNGLPFVAETFIASEDSIANDRDKLKALLIAEIKGWADAINDPEAAATYVVDTYGSELGLTMAKESKQASVQSTDLVVSADTAKNGLFTITDELQKQSIGTLKAAGITVTADKLFDMSLLAEIYKENPDLIAYSK